MEKKIKIPEGYENYSNIAVSYREVSDPDETISMIVEKSGGAARKKLRAPCIIYKTTDGQEFIVYNDDELTAEEKAEVEAEEKAQAEADAIPDPEPTI